MDQDYGALVVPLVLAGLAWAQSSRRSAAGAQPAVWVGAAVVAGGALIALLLPRTNM